MSMLSKNSGKIDFEALTKESQEATCYDEVRGILEFYECPKECGAKCCKSGLVMVSEAEKNVLMEIAPERAEKMIEMEVDFFGETIKSYKMTEPCSFLGEYDKCVVHGNAPWTCQMYPFKTLEDENWNRGLNVVACPLGVIVAEDFIDMKIEVIKQAIQHKIVKPKEAQKHIRSLKKHLKIMKEYSKTFQMDDDGDRIPVLFIEMHDVKMMYGQTLVDNGRVVEGKKIMMETALRYQNER